MRVVIWSRRAGRDGRLDLTAPEYGNDIVGRTETSTGGQSPDQRAAAATAAWDIVAATPARTARAVFGR
jgi:hypothetical protein